MCNGIVDEKKKEGSKLFLQQPQNYKKNEKKFDTTKERKERTENTIPS